MSHAYTEVRHYGEEVHALCDECEYRQRFTWIKDANQAARDHNERHHRPGPPKADPISNYK